jgi:hypothetical protein
VLQSTSWQTHCCMKLLVKAMGSAINTITNHNCAAKLACSVNHAYDTEVPYIYVSMYFRRTAPTSENLPLQSLGRPRQRKVAGAFPFQRHSVA